MKKVAIACQGGGSHTAFTAGVLKSVLNELGNSKGEQAYEIVSLSGTSGGAICAFYAWYALLKYLDDSSKPPDVEPLQSFWDSNSTNGNIGAYLMNRWISSLVRMQEKGFYPALEINPNSYLVELCQSSYKESMQCCRLLFPLFSACIPPANYFDLHALLKATSPVDQATPAELEDLTQRFARKGPVLLIGAANVGSGHFKIFNSRKVRIGPNHLLASAAIPNIFAPVKIEGQYYWDGLFSDNPPIDELLNEKSVGSENLPEELWVIQINPAGFTRDSPQGSGYPQNLSQITDRKNELSGNLSLFHGLKRIDKINELLETFREHHDRREERCLGIDGFCKKYREVKIKIIQMPTYLQQSLDRASKIDRDKPFLDSLIREGVNSGRSFLSHPSNPEYSWEKVKEKWDIKAT